MTVLYVLGRTHRGRPLEPRVFRDRGQADDLLRRWLAAIAEGFSGPDDHADMWECEVAGPVESGTVLFVIGYAENGRLYPPKVRTSLVEATDEWEGVLSDLGPHEVRTPDSDERIVPGQTVRARDRTGEQEGCVWSVALSAQ